MIEKQKIYKIQQRKEQTMKKIISILIVIFVLMFTLVSCSSGAEGNGGGSYAGSDGMENDYKGESGSTDSTAEANRKIIKTVNQSVQTDAYDEFMDSLNEAISAVGGYISSSNYKGDNYYSADTLRYASLTVRIPAEKLDTFTADVDSLAIVTSFSENVTDVTLSYIDVESRISVLESEETALTAMLSSATTVDQMLSIRERLLDVQSDLASLRAQKNSYDDKISYSTVYLTVNEVRRAVAKDPGFFEEVGANFSENLYNIGQFFRDLAVWLLGDSLVILIWAAVIVGLVFLYKLWRKKHPKTPKANRTIVVTKTVPAAPASETTEESNE